jgi:uncharacterized protein with PIN domain
MDTPPRFACDAMLGGLARWLRAAGYDASWHDGIPDRDLVRLGQSEGKILLSSDTDIFGYALVRDGIVQALFVPRAEPIPAQLAHILRELQLPLREPRCMACSGELVGLPKAEAGGLVPPGSLAAHELFWRCRSCGKAFWHGTHWKQIAEGLRQAAGGPDAATESRHPAG